MARRTCNPHMAHTFRQRRRGCGKRVIITWLKLRLHTEVPVESGPDERVSLRHARMSRKLRRYIGVHAEPSCHPVTDSSFIAGECSPAFSEQEDPGRLACCRRWAKPARFRAGSPAGMGCGGYAPRICGRLRPTSTGDQRWPTGTLSAYLPGLVPFVIEALASTR